MKLSVCEWNIYLKKKKKRYLIIYGDSVVPADFRNKVDALINGGIKFFLLENHFFFSRKTETFNSLIHWIQTECLTLIATFTFNIIASISPTASTSLSLRLSPSLPRCGMNNFKSGWLPRPRWVTPRRVSTSAQSGWCRGDLGKPQ